MARRRKLRVTTPEFMHYVNMEREFAVSDPDHQDDVWQLVAKFFPGIDWRCGYTPDKVWHELKAHQPTFRAVLDGLIAQELSPAQEATIRLHVGHFGPHPRWGHSPARSCIDPEQVVDVEVYGQVFELQDPLDPLYYQLHMFLLKRHGRDLKRCPTCGHYFFALTAGTKVYCSDSCRGKQTPAEAKRKAVQKWRAGETEQDLEEVRAAVQQVRDCGAREFVFEEVWAQYQELGERPKRPIGPRRFKLLSKEGLGAELMC